MAIKPFRPKKKKEEIKTVPVIEPPVCRHHWKDFKWYVEACFTPWTYGKGGQLDVKIIEPYVCIHCKERQDKILAQKSYDVSSKKEAAEYVDEYIERFKDHIEDKAIINDQIADFQLVDREYLMYYEQLMRLKHNPPLKIEVPNN